MASGQKSSPDRIRHQWPDVVVFHLSGTTWFRFDTNKKSRKFNWTLWCQAGNTGLTIILFSGEPLNFFYFYLSICMCILIINPANLLQDEDLWVFLDWCCASTGAAPTEATELFFSPVCRDPPLRHPPPTWGKCRARRRESTATLTAWSMSRRLWRSNPPPTPPAHLFSDPVRASAVARMVKTHWDAAVDARTEASRWLIPAGGRPGERKHWWSLTDRPCNQASQWFWVIN